MEDHYVPGKDDFATQTKPGIIQVNSRDMPGASSEMRPTGPEILRLAQPVSDLQLSSENQQFFLWEYWQVLVKRLWVILGSLTFMLAAAVIVSLHMTPMYRAEGQITINRENPNPLGFKDNAATGDNDPNVIADLATDVKILKSNSLAVHAIQKLPSDEQFKGSAVNDMDRNATLTGPSQPSMEQQTQLARRFRAGLTVEAIPGTRMIEVAYVSSNPRAAADAANALIGAYIEQNLKTRFEATTQAAEWLTKQLSDLQVKVEISEGKLVRYQKEHGIVGADEKQNIITSKLEDLNKQLTDSEADRIQKQAIYQLTLSGDPEAVSTVGQDAFLQSLRAQQAELKNQLAQATVQRGSAYPTVVELKNRMQQLDVTIDAELKKTISRIHNDYTGALVREKMLRQAFEQQKDTASQLNQNAIEYSLLKRDADSNRQLYDSLMQKLKEAGLSAGLSSTNVHIVDPATPPPAPFSPDIPRNLEIGFLIGLTGGIALALSLEGLDNTVRTPDQAEAIAALPLLATVPFAKRKLPNDAKNGHRLLSYGLQNAGEIVLVSYTRPKSPVAEAYRALRTSILLSLPDAPPQVILITSPLPQDGKTTTSINCAIVLAQEHRRVLLVETDLRRPSFAKVLGFRSTAGLSNVLAGTALPASTIFPSPQLPNLFVLPSGPIAPSPSELLGSTHMEHLLTQWRGMFDHIIFDTAPILAVTDAVRLSIQADGVLLVVRSAQTPKAALRRASILLAQVKAKVLGIVVNAVDSTSQEHYYYYGGTKYAGAYSDAEDTEETSA
jgi:capsular exopolysaccharide synthesis family protein